METPIAHSNVVQFRARPVNRQTPEMLVLEALEEIRDAIHTHEATKALEEVELAVHGCIQSGCLGKYPCG